MSRQIEARVQTQWNRFSILLSILRRHLSSTDYQGLLRMQNLSEQWLRTHAPAGEGGSAWLGALGLELDDAFMQVAAGSFSRRHLRRVAHLYGHLFRKTEVRSQKS